MVFFFHFYRKTQILTNSLTRHRLRAYSASNIFFSSSLEVYTMNDISMNSSNDISIGILSDLKSVNNSERINNLNNAFQSHFDVEPTFFANVPGR